MRQVAALNADFHTVTELEANPRKILNKVCRSRRPAVLTENGKPSAVLLDVASYERKLSAAVLEKLLAESQASVQAGRTRPAEEFFAELEREQKVPRRNHSRSRARHPQGAGTNRSRQTGSGQ